MRSPLLRQGCGKTTHNAQATCAATVLTCHLCQQVGDKSQLLETHVLQAQGTGALKLELTWTPPPWRQALMVLEGATQASKGERSQQHSPPMMLMDMNNNGWCEEHAMLTLTCNSAILTLEVIHSYLIQWERNHAWSCQWTHRSRGRSYSIYFTKPA